LDDLPPKIIQDYHSELSPLQRALYDRAADSSKGEEDASDGGKAKEHVFASLQYLRKLVNHPLLVLTPEEIAASTVDLHDISQAPKLEALRQILTDCGIGTPVKAEEMDSEEPVAPHRVLIFAQMKQTLDLIETDLFAAHMPGLTYMRLDGSTPVMERHPMVQRFNSDPSIDCMLLTTHVGGLGLTLTGADTVVFVEHDWNPMKDLQAMDRAHRLGQKRVVNVYRLIMRDTIEEKIMGCVFLLMLIRWSETCCRLQKFKLNIASSVVNDENSGMGTMETDQVLDLFDTSEAPVKASGKPTQLTRKALLEGLGDLPEE
jgi:TATA-binding protein-associated factor